MKNLVKNHALLRVVVLLFVSLWGIFPGNAQMGDQTGAQMGEIPRLFDGREKFGKPDLAQWQQLLFLTTVDFPPFNYIDRTGTLAGYHVDLARSICMELHIERKCQIEAVPWAELTTRLEKSRSGESSSEVFIAGVAPTAQNRMVLAFTKPYMRFPARFMALKTTASDAKMMDTLTSRKIGLVRARVHEKLFAAYFPTSVPLLFEDEENLYAALKAGEIDLAFGDGMQFSLWLASMVSDDCCIFVGEAYFAPAYLGEGMRIAVPIQHQALIQAFNQALQALERKNKLQELYLKYFPVDFY